MFPQKHSLVGRKVLKVFGGFSGFLGEFINFLVSFWRVFAEFLEVFGAGEWGSSERNIDS